MENKIKLSKKNWDLIADYIKYTACGCFYSNFDGKALKSDVEGFVNK